MRKKGLWGWEDWGGGRLLLGHLRAITGAQGDLPKGGSDLAMSRGG